MEGIGETSYGDEDFGYTVHSWLRAAFGEQSPHSFRIIGQPMERIRVLAYGSKSLASLKDHAERYAAPLTVDTCKWEDCASKSLEGIAPSPGETLNFEVRVCPVIRNKERERDAFLAALPENRAERTFGREDVYRKWIVQRMSRYVEVEEASIQLISFRLVSTLRKSGSANNGRRSTRKITLPDALLDGTLRIRDESKLQELLKRGVGRHRSFGFGMLLLRPS